MKELKGYSFLYNPVGIKGQHLQNERQKYGLLGILPDQIESMETNFTCSRTS